MCEKDTDRERESFPKKKKKKSTGSEKEAGPTRHEAHLPQTCGADTHTTHPAANERQAGRCVSPPLECSGTFTLKIRKSEVMAVAAQRCAACRWQ